MLPDFERADRIGEFWSYPESRAFAELLLDWEEDRTCGAVLVGTLRETCRGRWGATGSPRPAPRARGHDLEPAGDLSEIGRASCRERV